MRVLTTARPLHAASLSQRSTRRTLAAPSLLHALPPRSVRAAASSGGGGGSMASLLNSLKNALGGAAAGGPGGDGGEDVAASSAKAFAASAPSWADLASLVAAQRESLGVPEPDLENGPTNAAALVRSFGSAAEPRVTLFRDHAAWCPYCHKIWLQLEAKRIPYRITKINMRAYGPKPPEYMARVPSGLLPALELDGVLYTESAVIADVLEASFPEHEPLVPRPDDAAASARHTALMRLERQLFGDWLGWLCQPGGHDARRGAFMRTLGMVEDALASSPGGGPFFMGPTPQLPDCVFAPFLERMAASIPYYKGERLRGDAAAFPRLNAWWDAMDAWPVYGGTRSDYYTHVHDLPPQLGGCVSHASPSTAAMAADVDGTDGRAWRLPLAPLGTGPAGERWAEDPPADRLRAAARLVANHGAVARFAARGPAPPGRPAVGARLSDPYAQPDEAALPAIDAALRHVAHALLAGPERAAFATGGAAGGGGPSAALPGGPAALGLAYLRDRVGVPRDLPLPAARQLRAHLNWFIDAVVGA